MRTIFPTFLIALFVSAATASAQTSRPTTRPTTQPATRPAAQLFALSSDGSSDWLLHLPGISGVRNIDRNMLRGLLDGGFRGEIETYDWTGIPGLPALLARVHNEAEAVQIAGMIADRARAAPGARIIVTSHSGGTGLLAWALERLPADVKVDTVLLLSPALSPRYDLSKALSHVRGKAYYLSSPNDTIVLGLGTVLFGTIDGEKTQSAGKVGFDKPANADDAQYAKLVAMPYDRAWRTLGNIGSHIGSMSRPFAEEVLSPLVTGKASPATQPVIQRDRAAGDPKTGLGQ